MKKIRKIQSQFQDEIDKVTKELLLAYDKNMNHEKFKGYITDTLVGRAYFRGPYFTVPFWAYNPRHKHNKKTDGGYFIYYVAHELSHKLNRNEYSHHDSYFYEIFTKLCPKHLQHFELSYKKTSSKYGISKNN